MKKKSIDCFIRVEDALDSCKEDIFLPPNEKFTLKIDYPLDKPASFEFKTGSNGMGTMGIINQIAKRYEEVYENEEKYAIWGHDIGDLTIEGINVDFSKKVITIDVGS